MTFETTAADAVSMAYRTGLWSVAFYHGERPVMGTLLSVVPVMGRSQVVVLDVLTEYSNTEESYELLDNTVVVLSA